MDSSAVKLGDEARGRGDWVTAAEQYRLHVEKKPNDFAIWVQRGHALKEQGERVEALVAYSTALHLNSRDADLLLNLGHLNKLMGHNVAAASFYQRSADIDANSNALGELQAFGHVRSLPVRTAVAGLAPANMGPPSDIQPFLPSALVSVLNRAKTRHRTLGDRARGRGDWAAAAKQYELHVEVRPGDFAIWVQLGHAFKECGRLKEALDAYNRALRLKPQDADLLLNLAHLHKRMGSRSLAFDFYSRSAARDGNRSASEELEWLNESVANATDQAADRCADESSARHDPPTDAVDPKWYLATYPDVANSGMDAAEHYRNYGRAEGRSPNALVGSPIDRVDPQWYFAAYPDVANSGMDAAEHYRNYGRAEGRSPNARAGSQSNPWATRFNSDWYAARNGDLGEYAADPFSHFVTVGLKEGRSPNPHEEPREPWRQVLDVPWYLERNPDVQDAQLDPLEHYIFHGIQERRKPNRHTELTSRAVLSAKIDCIKKGKLGSSVALFITHTADGNLKPHVEPYLRSLRRAGISTVLIIQSDISLTGLPDAIKALVDVIYRRDNQGFDFSAWAHILRLTPKIYGSKILYLLNDSVFGPVSQEALEGVLAQVNANEAQLVGLTANWERGWHIQSYFLAIKAPILASTHFQDFINGIVSYYNKEDVINEYETQFSKYLEGKGFKCDALFASPDRRNATVHHWRDLIGRGFPFLKIGFLWGAIDGIDTTGWRETLSVQGYDVNIADRTLAGLIAGSRRPPTTSESQKREFRRESLAELHRFFADGQDLEVPAAAHPQVSIILVLYNQAELTLRCLRSIIDTANVAMEVIIVDNASTDDTQYLLSRIKNARLIRNNDNVHFLRASNQGSELALGEALLFLNNDTSLTKNAIEYGLETLNGQKDVGAVGGKLILPDGTLQEAGSIVFRDGNCLGYGRGRSPEDISCNYRRDVDYCSGAFLIMRRELFERMGRFDTVYAPAYYEETDLCLRIWDHGLRVVYDPRIAVNHFEFGSSASSQAAVAADAA